jgi:predicted nucleotidyltransferase
MKMTEREQIIYTRLDSDFKYVKDLGYNVLGVFLQGSQNYHLDYEGSDIDTKAIIIPSFEDFVLNRKPVSTTLILPSNEHIDLKDIRLMHDCFRKQNINFLEILFTKYFTISDDYMELYKPMFDNKERIAHYNNYASVNCIAGMVYEKHKALEHPYPTLKDKIEKYGYDNKQLHHIIRCEEFLKRYINGVPYAECLIPTNPQYLINIKSEYIYSLEEARQMAKNIEYIVKLTKQNYMDNNPCVIDKEVEDVMNSVLINVLKFAFKKEIGE